MAKDGKSTEGALVVICNPLLDISAEVPMALIEKYGLKLNNAILAEPKHAPIYRELESQFKVQYIAGGAGQNTARVAQWMLQQPQSASFFGCVGADEYAERVRRAAEGDHVRVHYQVDAKEPTGTCACLIFHHERSLVANIAAANNFKPAHLETPESKAIIDKAQVFYSSGFFLTVSPDSVMMLAKHALEHNKLYVSNLSAPFICQFFDKPLLALLPYCDIIIGNESEAEAFAKKQGYADASPRAVAQKLFELPHLNQKRERIAIVTQGARPTIVVTKAGVREFQVPRVPEEELVDVNGAGDAFVGGLLAALVKGHDIEAAVHAGHYAAGVIVRVSGTVLPHTPPKMQL
jgi:adenosine kinase